MTTTTPEGEHSKHRSQQPLQLPAFESVMWLPILASVGHENLPQSASINLKR